MKLLKEHKQKGSELAGFIFNNFKKDKALIFRFDDRINNIELNKKFVS
jgi:hypothetical protein